MNLIPLLYVLAAKPATSPNIPPPKDTMQSSLLKFLLNKVLCIFSILLWSLLFSLETKYKINKFLLLKFLINDFVKFIGIFLSIINSDLLSLKFSLLKKFADFLKYLNL